MKIEFEPHDLERIEYCKENPSERILFNTDDREKMYSISFKVEDPFKAEAFIAGLLFNQKKSKEFQDLIGIDFTSLNFVDYSPGTMRSMRQEINNVLLKYLGE